MEALTPWRDQLPFMQDSPFVFWSKLSLMIGLVGCLAQIIAES